MLSAADGSRWRPCYSLLWSLCSGLGVVGGERTWERADANCACTPPLEVTSISTQYYWNFLLLLPSVLLVLGRDTLWLPCW
ncbi:hypothetical protein BOTBODRAFT_574210 [Botryobasidium botryosum FD-172 SS1]|uniref:Uncharacterized protein n=1 Tax=Botryobasidium botryosum (strain FD-172 SS1) TaxID=930990 RepID=A0A067MNY9_BOTB1|nr:hypothetical protein BOTBODRAFT_574210 [Botryobasidium botryosum FD-172 SS1]